VQQRFSSFLSFPPSHFAFEGQRQGRLFCSEADGSEGKGQGQRQGQSCRRQSKVEVRSEGRACSSWHRRATATAWITAAVIAWITGTVICRISSGQWLDRHGVHSYSRVSGFRKQQCSLEG
jgi:hypothetical protein